MRAVTVRPTGVERTFGPDELIVSKTDAKGVIRYANGVFRRVSKYTSAQLVGQPHNIIRHPDMPRCVFQLMWDQISAGKELFAYVLNLASDGAHYWVFAHVTPTFDATGKIVGYHSNRRLPEPAAVTKATTVYTRLLAEQKRHSLSSEGLRASTQLLHKILAEQGTDYDRWVWDITTGTPALR